jgi:ribulose-phosphate 3-epimerase
MTVRIAPSILAADFAHLARDVAAAEAGGADLIHVDVMDGHFVPNLTVGPPVVRSLRRATTLPLDVHLMIEDPDRYLEAFIEAGASMVSVHVEAAVHLHRTLAAIKQAGARAGVVLNPSTAVTSIAEVAGDVDFVLIMSVNPGFGGQTFIEHSVDKIRRLQRLLEAAGNPVPIEVDGGIDVTTARRVVAAGASILVAGQAIFGSPDAAAAVRAIRSAAEA